MRRANSLEKPLILGKIEGRRRGGDRGEMVEWHHRLNGHEFEQTPGDSEGQGSLACCSPWDCKELDMTERLDNNKEGKGNIQTLPRFSMPSRPSKQLWTPWISQDSELGRIFKMFSLIPVKIQNLKGKEGHRCFRAVKLFG